MEIGMKEDKDVADEMSLSNLVSRSTRNLAQSATRCTYLQFIVLEGTKQGTSYMIVHEDGYIHKNSYTYMTYIDQLST